MLLAKPSVGEQAGYFFLLVKRRWWEDKQRQWGWAGSRLEELEGEAEAEGGFHKNMLLCVCRKPGQKALCIEGLGKTD